MTEDMEKTPPSHEAVQPEKPDVIRVLLVDDEQAYVDVLANRLRKRGLDVKKSYSSAEALLNLRRHDFDVAILDLKMADMDGIEVLKIARMIDPVMQVIMLTGHGSAESARQGMELGAFDYLMKPCELDTLVTKIREAFQQKQKNVRGEEGENSSPAG